MARDSNHFLNELTIWKLRTVAEAYKIDISTCRNKRDCIQKIASKNLTEEQVRMVLEKVREDKRAGTKGEESGRGIEDIEKEIAEISVKGATTRALPPEDEKALERHLDDALMMRPSMFEVDSVTADTHNRMIVGDYYGAILANRDARMKCLDGFSTFQVYSAAVSIRAADELLSKLEGEKAHVDAGLSTALVAAKKAFINGPPRTREEALESLETLVTKTYETILSAAERDEAELKDLLSDYESFGTRTEESRKYLEIASQAKQASNVGEYARYLKDARAHAEKARTLRTAEIGRAFPMVRASAAAAKEIGVDTATAEAGIAEAEKAFEKNSLKQAVDLLASIERVTDEAHLQRMKSQKELEKRQTERLSLALASYEPILSEASSYGIVVQDGVWQLGNLRESLSRRDLINAAKYAHLVKGTIAGMERNLDAKRVESGAIKHLDGASCSKCGKESLYSFANSTQKCLDCGHSYSIPEGHISLKGMQASDGQKMAGASEVKSEEPAGKKRKGLFGWRSE